MSHAFSQIRVREVVFNRFEVKLDGFFNVRQSLISCFAFAYASRKAGNHGGVAAIFTRLQDYSNLHITSHRIVSDSHRRQRYYTYPAREFESVMYKSMKMSPGARPRPSLLIHTVPGITVYGEGNIIETLPCGFSAAP